MIINMDDVKYTMLKERHRFSDEQRKLIKKCENVEYIVENQHLCWWFIYILVKYVVEERLFDIELSYDNSFLCYFLKCTYGIVLWSEMEEVIREQDWCRYQYEWGTTGIKL